MSGVTKVAPQPHVDAKNDVFVYDPFTNSMWFSGSSGHLFSKSPYKKLTPEDYRILWAETNVGTFEAALQNKTV